MIEKLLKSLIEIPSVSGREQRIAEFVFKFLKDKDLNPELLLGNNVYCEIGKGKKALLFNSHLDTVPPSGSWVFPPFKSRIIAGRIYGLGASDTKGSLAAMMEMMVDLKKTEKELKGRVIFLATDKEEVQGSGMEKLAESERLKFDNVIIGEPTNLNICIAERGLVKLKIIAKGRAAHAAALTGFNAIHKAAEDIEKINNLSFKRSHKLLGRPSVQVTIINGGIKSNVIPDRCEFIVDIRSTPIYPNNYLINSIKNNISSDVQIMSNRIFPKETNMKERIVKSAQKAAPGSRITGFWAASDFAFIKKPGIILGPGSGKQAHSGNEFVEISQVKKAKEIYIKIINNLL